MFAPQFETLRSQPRRQRGWHDVAQSSYPKLWDGTPYDPPRSTLREEQLTYLYTLARDFSSFYEACPILRAEGHARTSRLLLTDMTGKQLSSGLEYLGIGTIERM